MAQASLPRSEHGLRTCRHSTDGAKLKKQRCLKVELEDLAFVKRGSLGRRLAAVIKDQSGALHQVRLRSKFSVGQEFTTEILAKEVFL